jgi:hypothetical protein
MSFVRVAPGTLESTVAGVVEVGTAAIEFPFAVAQSLTDALIGS